MCVFHCCFFFFKQKTAYEMRISDWSSDVCSSDLVDLVHHVDERPSPRNQQTLLPIAWKTHIVAMKGIGSGHRDGLLARAFHVKTGFALPLRPKHSFIESASQHHGLQHVEQRIDVQPGVPRACCAIIDRKSKRLNSHH